MMRLMYRRPVVAIADVNVVAAIAREIAVTMAARGFRVALYHSRLSRAQADVIVDALGTDSVYCHALGGAGWDGIFDAVAATTAVFGEAPTRAAIFAPSVIEGDGPLFVGGRDEHDTFQRTAAHLHCMYSALRALLPAMVERRDGAIVVGASRLGERPWESEGAALGGAIRAAVLALVHACAAEVRTHAVRVNAISLAITPDTEATTLFPNLGEARWPTAESVAKVATFLLSDEARELTATTLPMYGQI
jgi:NAD(P)-dependent dehydrogenase (short-subunit alcohol dehydrogenase family)